MVVLFVNSAWDSGNFDYTAIGPDGNSYSLVWGDNAFNSVASAVYSVNDNETIHLLSDCTYTPEQSDHQVNFSITAAKGCTLTLDGSGNFPLKISCNVVIADGVGSEVTGDLTVNGNLAVNGTLTCDGNITVANGASLSVENYEGTGTISLDPNADLSITNGTPKININLPDNPGNPYEQLAFVKGITDAEAFIAADTDYATKKTSVLAATENDKQGLKFFYSPKNLFFVNSDYKDGYSEADGSTPGFGITTFASATAAATAAANSTAENKKIFVTGGVAATADDKAIAFNGIEAQILGVTSDDVDTTNLPVAETATFAKCIAGGAIDTARSDIAGLTINGGTFTKAVVGGDFITSGSASHSGDISLTINGGTFGSIGGGMAYTAKSPLGKAELSGNIDFTITGGTFTRRVYGGSLCNNIKDGDQAIGDYGNRIQIVGNVNLTIDAQNDITFKEHIVAGSYGSGSIYGDTTVTFKGDGSKLTFKGIVCGGSGATYFTSGTCNSYIKVNEAANKGGNRTIAFDGFSGSFGGQIKAFRTANFTNGTTVTFTKASNLKDIEAWTFADGATLTAMSCANNFTGDSLVLDGTARTVMTGSDILFKGWDAFSSVKLGGENASKVTTDGKVTAWASTNYQLSLTGDDNSTTKSLVLASK